jgi:trimethyllysine dioxygenase
MWNELLKSSDSEYWVQLTAGTAVGTSSFLLLLQQLHITLLPVLINPISFSKVIDNHRVLHGRSAFEDKRRMCGAYIGADEYKSKLAVLSDKYAPGPVLLDTQGHDLTNGRSVWNPAL